MNEASCIGFVRSFVECDDHQLQRTSMSGKLEAQQTATVERTKSGACRRDPAGRDRHDARRRTAETCETGVHLQLCRAALPRSSQSNNFAFSCAIGSALCQDFVVFAPFMWPSSEGGEDEMKKEQVTTSGTWKEEEDSPSSLQNRIPHSISTNRT